MLQPYPEQDNKRLGRLVADVCDLLHDNSEKTQKRAERWIFHVLNVANRYRRDWWFLENSASTPLLPGADVIDLSGQLGRINGIYVGRRLRQVPYQRVLELRSAAQKHNRPNGGAPKLYAAEAGRRVHLWPCPDRNCNFVVAYSRPFDLEILPAEWETILLDGVLGLYGRHFDRDALSQDPIFFEQRFRQALREAAPGTGDLLVTTRYQERRRAYVHQVANSADDEHGISFVVPASVKGIGHVRIELPPYPLTVDS